jgi:hypothetical protein
MESTVSDMSEKEDHDEESLLRRDVRMTVYSIKKRALP